MSSAGLWAFDGWELYRLGQASERVRYQPEKVEDIEDMYDAWKYEYFLEGVLGVLQWQGIVALPEDVTIGQIMNIVTKYLSDQPASRRFGAIYITTLALASAYGEGPNWDKTLR